ncbi:MAG: AAA family ATPase [Sedimentisphaerales bacterium]|nr:AAA family ATPase [Sedimentisphaerales bacterium]
MRTIAIVNQKGGVGKTTVSINLASALAEQEARTLLVDMDPQSHCAVGLAVPEEQIEQSIYDVLISITKDEPIRIGEVLWEINEKLELAPASIDLTAYEQQMAGVFEREDCLKKVLETVKDQYDFIIIDCPPAVGLLTFSALRAATDVIVPVETGYFSLHGLSKQLETLAVLCQRCKQNVNVKVLASMYDIRTKMAREILSELRTHFGDKMFKTVVNFNTKLKEAQSLGQPIGEYDPASKGHNDFQTLAKELLQYEPEKHRRQIVESLSEKLESISATAEQLLEQAKPRIKTIEPAKPKTPKEEPVTMHMGSKPGATEAKTRLQTPAAARVPVTKPQTTSPKFTMTDAKLSDYYGVNQMNEAVVFVTLYPRAQSVQVAGDFNDWQPTKMQMEKIGDTGVWQASAKLSPGKYRYRLVVDGQWQQDPYNETTELNPFGGYNSIVEVK